jgi:hypothetical protein
MFMEQPDNKHTLHYELDTKKLNVKKNVQDAGNSLIISLNSI